MKLNCQLVITEARIEWSIPKGHSHRDALPRTVLTGEIIPFGYIDHTAKSPALHCSLTLPKELNDQIWEAFMDHFDKAVATENRKHERDDEQSR